MELRRPLVPRPAWSLSQALSRREGAGPSRSPLTGKHAARGRGRPGTCTRGRSACQLTGAPLPHTPSERDGPAGCRHQAGPCPGPRPPPLWPWPHLPASRAHYCFYVWFSAVSWGGALKVSLSPESAAGSETQAPFGPVCNWVLLAAGGGVGSSQNPAFLSRFSVLPLHPARIPAASLSRVPQLLAGAQTRSSHGRIRAAPARPRAGPRRRAGGQRTLEWAAAVQRPPGPLLRPLGSPRFRRQLTRPDVLRTQATHETGQGHTQQTPHQTLPTCHRAMRSA